MEGLQRALSRLLSKAREAPATVVVGTLGALAALLLVIAEFSTVVAVDISTGDTCEVVADPAVRDTCNTTGFEQHSGALLLLAIAAAVMTCGAARRASRPASVALVAIGIVTVLVWLLRDMPQIHKTGLVGVNFDGASASAASGFYLEVVAGGLCVVTGLAALAVARSARPPEEPRRRPRPTAAG